MAKIKKIPTAVEDTEKLELSDIASGRELWQFYKVKHSLTM